ncbi:CFIA complex component [Mycena kentingensis (nom. inval.)]|nr:CFIA complex component [Mycena kentingensis (nom. inval.)]
MPDQDDAAAVPLEAFFGTDWRPKIEAYISRFRLDKIRLFGDVENWPAIQNIIEKDKYALEPVLRTGLNRIRQKLRPCLHVVMLRATLLDCVLEFYGNAAELEALPSLDPLSDAVVLGKALATDTTYDDYASRIMEKHTGTLNDWPNLVRMAAMATRPDSQPQGKGKGKGKGRANTNANAKVDADFQEPSTESDIRTEVYLTATSPAANEGVGKLRAHQNVGMAVFCAHLLAQSVELEDSVAVEKCLHATSGRAKEREDDGTNAERARSEKNREPEAAKRQGEKEKQDTEAAKRRKEKEEKEKRETEEAKRRKEKEKEEKEATKRRREKEAAKRREEKEAAKRREEKEKEEKEKERGGEGEGGEAGGQEAEGEGGGKKAEGEGEAEKGGGCGDSKRRLDYRISRCDTCPFGIVIADPSYRDPDHNGAILAREASHRPALNKIIERDPVAHTLSQRIRQLRQSFSNGTFILGKKGCGFRRQEANRIRTDLEQAVQFQKELESVVAQGPDERNVMRPLMHLASARNREYSEGASELFIIDYKEFLQLSDDEFNAIFRHRSFLITNCPTTSRSFKDCLYRIREPDALIQVQDMHLRQIPEYLQSRVDVTADIKDQGLADDNETDDDRDAPMTSDDESIDDRSQEEDLGPHPFHRIAPAKLMVPDDAFRGRDPGFNALQHMTRFHFLPPPPRYETLMMDGAALKATIDSKHFPRPDQPDDDAWWAIAGNANAFSDMHVDASATLVQVQCGARVWKLARGNKAEEDKTPYRDPNSRLMFRHWSGGQADTQFSSYEPIALDSSMILIMRPMICHQVVTVTDSVASGVGTVSKACLPRAIQADIHHFMAGSVAYNVDHRPNSNLLRILVMQLETYLYRPSEEWSSHILKLDDPHDLKAFVLLIAHCVLMPALDLDAYTTIEKHGLPRVFWSKHKMLTYAWWLAMTADVFQSIPEPVDVDPPVDAFDSGLTRLQQDAPNDTEGWKRFVDLAESSGDMKCIRRVYDALLKQYPNNPSAQTAYISHFLASRSDDDRKEAETLLRDYLRTSPCVDIWRCYLDYVRCTIQQGTQSRETLRKAYDFALSHIGQDRDSGFIHSAYIKFLSEADTTTTRDAQERMDAIRKAYHRAVQIPLDNVEELWSDLEAFENGLNKITAKKFIGDLREGHMQARSVLRQLSNYLKDLNLANPQGELVLPVVPTFAPQEKQLVVRWKTYLKWEENNPLELEEKDRPTLVSRVQLAYRKAVARMRYYPEIWFMAYYWNLSNGNTSEAISILKQGLEANPGSFVLTFAYAEQLELAQLKKEAEVKDFSDVHALYDRFFAAVCTKLDELAPEEVPADSTIVTTSSDESMKDGDDPEEGAAAQRREEFNTTAKHYSNAWINYIAFARRAQGHKASRDAFGKARKCKRVGWEVFKAAAMTEYRCNQDDGKHIATRIFETGMKNQRFLSDPDFIISYLNYLLSINDENNARALFERVVREKRFKPEEAKPIWERWAKFQYAYDDLPAVLELEKRMAEAYPNGASFFDPFLSIQLTIIYRCAHKALRSTTHRAQNDKPTTSSNSFYRNNNGAVRGLGPSGDSNPMASGSNNNKKRPLPPQDRKHNEFKRQRQDNADRDWDRDRDRIGNGDGTQGRPKRKEPKKEEKTVLPAKLAWLVTQLPPAESYDGPIIAAESLVERLKSAVIPSTNRSRSPTTNTPRPASPQGPRNAGPGRPPPDYGPYQGPNGRAAAGKSKILNARTALAEAPRLPHFNGTVKGLKPDLYAHQREGLAWALKREAEDSCIRRCRSLDLTFKRGGIIADDMGMGKTVLMLALTLQTRGVRPEGFAAQTLIVAPVSVTVTWIQEISSHAPSLRCAVFRGIKDKIDFKSVDVVICSYNVLRNLPKPNLPWKRVIYDEAHLLRNPDTARHQTARSIECWSRWALTATPIINSLQDFGSLLAVLKTASPLDKISEWKARFAKTVSLSAEAINVVKGIVSIIALRRTKNAHGQPGWPTARARLAQVHLPHRQVTPPRIPTSKRPKALVQRRLIPFSQLVYNQLEHKVSDAELSTMQAMNILTLTLRLRQAALHADLVPSEHAQPIADGSSAGATVLPCMAPALDQFKYNWSVFSEGALADVNWDNIVVAGGSVLACLEPLPDWADSKHNMRRHYHHDAFPTSDIDVFLYGLSPQQAEAKIDAIYKVVRDSGPGDIACVRTKHTVTIYRAHPLRVIQIVLRLYASPAEVLAGFDVAASCCGYDGNRVYATPRAIVAMMQQSNSVDLERRSPSYENRLGKYAWRGYEVFVPGVTSRGHRSPNLR